MSASERSEAGNVEQYKLLLELWRRERALGRHEFLGFIIATAILILVSLSGAWWLPLIGIIVSKIWLVGSGTMISGFDEAVRGMEVGQVKKVTIPAAEAYGEYREDLLIVRGRDELEEELGIVDGILEVGDKVQLQHVETGEIRDFTVIDISETEIILDGNSELAGEDLTFEIEMVAIEPAGE